GGAGRGAPPAVGLHVPGRQARLAADVGGRHRGAGGEEGGEERGERGLEGLGGGHRGHSRDSGHWTSSPCWACSRRRARRASMRARIACTWSSGVGGGAVSGACSACPGAGTSTSVGAGELEVVTTTGRPPAAGVAAGAVPAAGARGAPAPVPAGGTAAIGVGGW